LLSVVLSTYNRGDLLTDALRSVLAQEGPLTPPFELIVVDNNSTDRTREVVGQVARDDGRLHYVFEPRQGLSCARNAGVLEARAPFVAFTDDDVRVAPDWVLGIVRAFEEHPGVDMVGGRVLPLWPREPPRWLTRDHWAPLALADLGDAALTISAEHPLCLVGANLACRRTVFDRVGGFATDLQRVKDGIGSLEDHEFLLRVLRTGRTGLYDPRIVVHAEIQPNRLERAYHRRWHTGHGHFHALMRSEHMERTTIGTLLGVPAHLYWQALGHLGGWLRARGTGHSARAFDHEMRLRFFAGFFRTRQQEFSLKSRNEKWDEFGRLLRLVVPRRAPATPAANSNAGRTQA
jgi:glycosyltransferase involved in cell wall biosynthesis